MKPSRTHTIMLSVSMIVVFSVLTLFLGGCGKSDDDRLLITIVDDDDSPPPDESAGDTETSPSSDEGTVIRIACWEDFLPQDLLDRFEDESGIAVEISPPPEPFDPMVLFSEHGDEYDLVMVDDFIIEELINRGDLARMEHVRIPNLDYVDSLFLLHPADEGRSYSVPITWGTMGILVNRDLVTDTDIGWDMLFDPRYSGLIDMPFEHHVLFVPPLLALGYPINERNPDILEDASDLLKDQKKIIHGYYDHDTIVRHVFEGSSAVAFAWSWMGMHAVDMGGNVEYIVPTSGTLIFSDCLVIPTGSPHTLEAEAFLNFLINPENMTRISDHLWMANTVPASWDEVNPALRDLEGVFLPEQTLYNSEYLEPLDWESEEILMELTDELFEMDYIEDVFDMEDDDTEDVYRQ